MRLAHENGQDGDDPFADVFGRDAQPLNLDVVRLDVVANRPADGVLQAAFVGASRRRADAVDVRAHRFVGRFRPLKRDLHLFAVVAGCGERSFRHRRLLAVNHEASQEFGDAAGVRQVERLFRHIVLEMNLQAAVDVRHVLQVVADEARVQLGRLEDVGVRLEIDAGSVSTEGAELLQLRRRFAAPERLLPLVAIAADGRHQLLGQGVDNRRADAVQAAGVDVAVAVAELGAGVQRRQDQLQGRPLVLGVRIDGNAAAVVGDRHGVAALVQRDGDGVGVAVEVLVHGVIDDFPDEVVQPLVVHAADVHGRPLADRLQAFQDDDVFAGIRRCAHCFGSQSVPHE